MEEKNPERKRLHAIIDELQGRDVKIVILDGPMTEANHRVAKFIASPDYLVIEMDNLAPEDRDTIRNTEPTYRSPKPMSLIPDMSEIEKALAEVPKEMLHDFGYRGNVTGDHRQFRGSHDKKTQRLNGKRR